MQDLKLTYEKKENEITLSTNEYTRDPCAIIKGKSILSVLSRGSDLETAILFLKDEDISYEIVNIEEETRGKGVMVNRRNRLLEKDTLNAIQEMTGCKVFVYGKTVTTIGKYKGVNESVRIIINCMKNKHPVYELRRLMVKRELEDKKELKTEDWDKLLPEVKKKVQKKKK